MGRGMTKSIYVIRNKINDKVYIGQSINPHRRFVQHLCNGNRLLDDYPIHLAINKYGKENFYYEIVEKSVENYDEREAYWINYYNSICPNGYNILPGGTPAPVLSGQSSPKNTLTDTQIEGIVDALLFSNLTQRKIAENYNTTERVVNSINSGNTHSKEDLIYPLRNKFCHFSQTTLSEIYWLLENTEASLQSIANFYKMTKGTVAQINQGRTHKQQREYPIRKNQGQKFSIQTIANLLIERGKENVSEGNN